MLVSLFQSEGAQLYVSILSEQIKVYDKKHKISQG